MFRNVKLSFYVIRPTRNYVTSAQTTPLNFDRIIKRQPFIICKNPKLNLLSDEIHRDDPKFGSISLASKGWKHRKSKGDYFVINPMLTEEDLQDMNFLENVESLEKYKMSPEIIENLKSKLEINKLTHIQAKAFPEILDMNHVLIAAETGCGKTLSYLLPIVKQILDRKRTFQGYKDLNSPLALILTPGRELASQIMNVTEKLCENTGITAKCILGGRTKQKMLNPEFDDIDILIGTVGAISKLTTTGIYRMSQVRHLVLDEADTLLDDSFSDKLSHFLKRFPLHKNQIQDLSNKIVGTQLILASATMPTNINELLCNVINPETIQEIVSPNLHRLMPHIQQKFLRMNKSDRPGELLTLVKAELKKNRALILFANKSATSDFISIFLNNSGVNCINLNGDMSMWLRMGQFEKFQNNEVNVLSTTDIGSRGLDTTRARHVINFDFPLHIADYIHRCGRIGRVGSHNNCVVTNFVSSLREIDIVQRIEHTARTGSLLPNVNGNITNIIRKRIMKDLENQGVDVNPFRENGV